jgi:arylsulfatase A-like enzyme/Flp pilus assembly protein TadD
VAIRSLLLLSLLTACSGDSAPGPKKKKKKGAEVTTPSVILLTLDTTRADRLGSYGYKGGHTPNLDALAQRGVRFERTYSSVPLTTPAHSTMFTGLYPTRHGVHNNGDAILPDAAVTLAEVLKEKGYGTAASVSAFVTTRMWNLDQGFDDYFDTVEKNPSSRWAQERPANEVVDDAITWLDKKEPGPFLLWLHFYDPHEPYRPPEPWATKLQGRPYDGEIAFMDEQIGRLMDRVKAMNQPVGWISVADHGEARENEHGETTHGMFLFDPTQRIPFIVTPPEPLAAPVVVSDLTVGNVDVMPTALGMLGISTPEGLDGVDLSPYIKGGTVTREGVYMESYVNSTRFGFHPELALAHGPLKLMKTPNPRLFDVVADPGETTNLYASRKADADRLAASFDEIAARGPVLSQAADLAPEVIQQLEALGYVGAGATSLKGLDSKIDGKDQIDMIRRLEGVRVKANNPATLAEAEQIYRDILRELPDLGEARMGLARLLQRNGRAEEAEGVLREALKLEPSSTVLHLNLASCLMQLQRYEEAMAEFNAILALVPTDPQGRQGVVMALTRLNRNQEGLDKALEWLKESPGEASLQGQAGLLMTRLNRESEAEPYLLGSLSDKVPRPIVHELLARYATQRGDAKGMVTHLQAELEILPSNYRARRALATWYMQNKQWDDAAAELQMLVELRTQDHAARVSWAQALFNAAAYEEAQKVLTPAIEAAPNNPEGLLLQANLLAKQGKRDEGAVLAKKAQELKSKQKGEPVNLDSTDDLEAPVLLAPPATPATPATP